MKTVIIIGGGAAGLAVASSMGNSNLNVIVIEKFNKCGKKILASGNGRCNISNSDIDSVYYNEINDNIATIINDFSIEEFFSSKGMFVKKVGKLYYPYSNQSSTVKNVLESSCKACKFVYETTATNILKQGKQYVVNTTNGKYYGDYVVITTGSPASLLSGTDNLLPIDSLDIDVKPWKSSLVSMNTTTVYKQLKGVRAKANVSLEVDGICIVSCNGEIQFTDYGLSGICIMQLSRYWWKNQGKNIEIRIDLCQDYSHDEMQRIFMERKKQFGSKYLEGILNDKLAFVLDKYNLDCKNLRFTVKSLRDCQHAQVMQGGIVLDEVNDDLELKKYKNIFVAGELLDVDGDCGGYNLHFAFASGQHVASRIVGREKECYK